MGKIDEKKTHKQTQSRKCIHVDDNFAQYMIVKWYTPSQTIYYVIKSWKGMNERMFAHLATVSASVCMCRSTSMFRSFKTIMMKAITLIPCYLVQFPRSFRPLNAKCSASYMNKCHYNCLSYIEKCGEKKHNTLRLRI